MMKKIDKDVLLICAIIWTMFMVTCIVQANYNIS